MHILVSHSTQIKSKTFARVVFAILINSANKHQPGIKMCRSVVSAGAPLRYKFKRQIIGPVAPKDLFIYFFLLPYFFPYWSLLFLRRKIKKIPRYFLKMQQFVVWEKKGKSTFKIFLRHFCEPGPRCTMGLWAREDQTQVNETWTFHEFSCVLKINLSLFKNFKKINVSI